MTPYDKIGKVSLGFFAAGPVARIYTAESHRAVESCRGSVSEVLDWLAARIGAHAAARLAGIACEHGGGELRYHADAD